MAVNVASIPVDIVGGVVGRGGDGKEGVVVVEMAVRDVTKVKFELAAGLAEEDLRLVGGW